MHDNLNPRYWVPRRKQYLRLLICLKEKVFHLFGRSAGLGRSSPFGRGRHNLKLVQIADKVELFGRVPEASLLLDKDLVKFRDEQDRRKEKDGSVGENEIGSGECAGQKDVVAGKEEDDGSADEQAPSGKGL